MLPRGVDAGHVLGEQPADAAHRHLERACGGGRKFCDSPDQTMLGLRAGGGAEGESLLWGRGQGGRRERTLRAAAASGRGSGERDSGEGGGA